MLDLNKKCSTCNKDQAAITDPESGEIICSNCGMVICERIEDTIHHQELCAYTIEEEYNRARIGLVLELDIKMPFADPMKCVVNVANKLGVSEKTKYQAMATMSEVVNSKINAGKVPLGFAASALCVMYEEW